MPRKKKLDIDSKIQEKLEYIGLNLDKVPKELKEYTNINFRTLKGYDEKKYTKYKFINVKDIEIMLSPTNRMDGIKEKYENALPLSFYLDNKNEENILNYTAFLNMLNKVSIPEIEAVEEEQKMLSKNIPFKVKFKGNYLWQIYYHEISEKYFMIVPIEDSDYSTFFYLLKKKIENKKQDKIFVPISFTDYDGEILRKSEIKDLENYLWLFTKDYPSIYEVGDKLKDVSLQIIGETEIYDKIKTLYKVNLTNKKDAAKFYKLVKALFILQTELPHYYKFDTNIDKDGNLNFYLGNTNIKYEILPEFIMEQYLKSVGLKEKCSSDIKEAEIKLKALKEESLELENEYRNKEKQITTYLECKKTFFGKVKYFFKLGKKVQKKIEKQKKVEEYKPEIKKEKFKLEEKNYTLYELEESLKELEGKEEKLKEMIMDINALKLKNKNLKRKIQNASNYLDEINKHKKSIFDFWKYANKDAVSRLDEGEEEEINVKKIEKVFNFEDEFEKFGIDTDKLQRNKFTDQELESTFIASTNLLDLINKINLGIVENKEISERLKELKIARELEDDDETQEETFNIFGRIKQTGNKERSIGNKAHREQQRDKYAILDIKKGSKGLELKRNLEKVIKDIKSAIKKNSLKEDTFVFKASSEKLNLDTFDAVSLSIEEELESFIKQDKTKNKIYLYKIKLPKGANYIGFSNIIYFDNKNMTLPVGMNLSTKILINFDELDIIEENIKSLKKLEFENEENDFSKITVKNIELIELKAK